MKLAAPLIAENLAAAERYSAKGEYARTVSYLETALSLVHGLLDGLADVLSE
jgi:hypothetical protein